jgi:SOS-response transcriptional repressor LexA
VHSNTSYALRVKGDFMTSPHAGQRSYLDGSIIFVDPDKPLTNGCRVIAKLHTSDVAIFKEYREDGGKHYLKPLNSQYPTLELIDDTKLCHVVIGQFIAD